MVRVNADVPDEIHRQAKSEAALRDMTLEEFVAVALENEVERGTDSQTNADDNTDSQ